MLSYVISDPSAFKSQRQFCDGQIKIIHLQSGCRSPPSPSSRLSIAQESREKSRMRSLTIKRKLLPAWMMTMMTMTLSILHTSSAFSPSLASGKASRGASCTRVHARTGSEDGTVSRRDWFGSLTAVGAVMCVPYQAAFAIDLTTVAPAVPMKDFLDPLGLFSIRVPKSYFALRRTAKGDLPDEKTGIGRRGSSIFTAGDMSKAELIAVER
jgi:hypothetical protein